MEDFGLDNLPGQEILPGFRELMRSQVHALKPFDEDFCLRYVETGSARIAYQEAVKRFKGRDVSNEQARKNGNALKNKPDVIRRISQYQAVTRASCMARVTAMHMRNMEFDPSDYTDDSGRILSFREMRDRGLSQGIGLKAVVIEGETIGVPQFCDPQKSLDVLTRMMGLDKTASSVELTGKNGEGIQLVGKDGEALMPAKIEVVIVDAASRVTTQDR